MTELSTLVAQHQKKQQAELRRIEQQHLSDIDKMLKRTASLLSAKLATTEDAIRASQIGFTSLISRAAMGWMIALILAQMLTIGGTMWYASEKMRQVAEAKKLLAEYQLLGATVVIRTCGGVPCVLVKADAPRYKTRDDSMNLVPFVQQQF